MDDDEIDHEALRAGIVARALEIIANLEEFDPDELLPQMKEMRQILNEAQMLPVYPKMDDPEAFVRTALQENSTLGEAFALNMSIRFALHADSLPEMAHAIVPPWPF